MWSLNGTVFISISNKKGHRDLGCVVCGKIKKPFARSRRLEHVHTSLRRHYPDQVCTVGPPQIPLSPVVSELP